MGTFVHRNGPESDVPLDKAVAWTRAVGGESNPSHPDQHSTTGTTPNETFVGRIAGDDIGYYEETGAERRAAAAAAAERRAAAAEGR
jgi:hypothetical protein